MQRHGSNYFGNSRIEACSCSLSTLFSNEVTNCKYSEFKAAIIRGPRALDMPAYHVKYENISQDTLLFKLLCVSCMKIIISITQFMFFSERNVRNVIFHFFFTRLKKGRLNQNWFPFGHVRFFTETSQIFATAF